MSRRTWAFREFIMGTCPSQSIVRLAATSVGCIRGTAHVLAVCRIAVTLTGAVLRMNLEVAAGRHPALRLAVTGTVLVTAAKIVPIAMRELFIPAIAVPAIL